MDISYSLLSPLWPSSFTPTTNDFVMVVRPGASDAAYRLPLPQLATFAAPALFLQDQKAANTNGGTSTAGSWQARELNTEVYDTIGSTLAANRFTLPIGTYDIFARVPSHGTSRTQARLRNISDGTTTLVGSSVYSYNAQLGSSDSTIMGRIALAAEKTFEIQMRSEATMANVGFGVASNFGELEIYTQIAITKVA